MTSTHSWRNLSPTEIGALALDGELWRSQATVCETDTPDDAVSRIAFARTHCPRDTIFARTSAAWIWDAFDRIPSRWTVTSRTKARLPTMPNQHFVVCDLKLEAADVVNVNESFVTSPTRTAIDIARYETALPEPTVVDIIRRLLAKASGDTDQGLEIYEQVSQSRHLPYKQKCLERLARATAVQPSLTRYTS